MLEILLVVINNYKEQTRSTIKTENTNELVFSEATEFLRGIETSTRKLKSKVMQNQTSSKNSEQETNAILMIDSLISEYGGYFNAEEVKGLTKKMHDYVFIEKYEQWQGEKNFLKEILLGLGLGNTVGLLRDRGLLNIDDVDWAGRNNDKKLMPHQALAKDALFSNSNKINEQTQRIEAALRRMDQYGRVLTAKEAFRELCYHFHGK